MINEPHGCRTCQNRRSNVCGRTSRFVSLASKSEWSEYLKKWGDAEAKLSIKIQPLGDVVGSCPHYKQHTSLLPFRVVREEE